MKKVLTSGLVVFALTGCAATQVAISKRTLDVQTKMSATVFLDPVAPEQRTVLVQIRNTSDKPSFDISSPVKAAISAKGYRVVEDPKRAHYILQANILQVGKNSPTAAESMFGGGYGTPLSAAAATGALTGAMAVGALGGSSREALGAALLVGIGETIAGAIVKDVYYTAITDLQIQERTEEGTKVDFSSKHTLKQGTSGSSEVSYAKKTDMQMYQTRILSSANKVNLEFAEAEPELSQGLVRSISGLF